MMWAVLALLAATGCFEVWACRFKRRVLERLRVAQLELEQANRELAEARRMVEARRDTLDPEHPLPWEMEWRD